MRLAHSEFEISVSNHLQPAMEKMQVLRHSDVRWHFIGAIQSRKAKEIARRFGWVHSLDHVDVARHLHKARSGVSQRLPVCVQVRGLMTIPAPCTDFEAQRRQFALLRRCQEQVCAAGFEMDKLLMGMRTDFETAIAEEGATWIRVGTALFGPRPDAGAAS